MFHCLALDFTAFRCIALHFVRVVFHCFVLGEGCIALHCFGFRCISFRCVALDKVCVAFQCFALG